MKNYEISFNNTQYSAKPSGDEIGKISNHLYTKYMDYRKLAYEVGECGCTFSPAVYDGRRRKENYIGQQLVGLDFDNGVSFSEIQNRADKYGLPMLFAYKTFSWTEEKEKFRIVFAMDKIMADCFTAKTVIGIFMKIFHESDTACKDVSRMFFGGKGLLYLAEREYQIAPEMLFTAFNTFMSDFYGDRHYKERIREYCSHNNIQVNSTGILWGTQELEHGGVAHLLLYIIENVNFPPKVHHVFQPLRHPEKEERLQETSTGILCTSAVSCSEASMTGQSITIIRNFF